MQPLLSGRSLAEVSLERLREFADPGQPYWLAYSGGKDSTVLLDLAKRAGVPFAAHYCYVPIDPPELRAFIRDVARDPGNKLSIDFPARSFIAEARARGMMPLRNRRWCCEVFKETAGPLVRLTLTGLRWAESSRRRRRKMVEKCYRRPGRLLNPILDWTDADVWDYIRDRGLPTCDLYREGWKRLGCVLCPMVRQVDKQAARWPGIARVWRRISEAIYAVKPGPWPSAEAMWAWWLDRDAKASDYTGEEAECPLFDGRLERQAEPAKEAP